MANGIKSFSFAGPAGKLEALLNEGSPESGYAAVVAHPHPLFGGTMHNKVVYHAMKALNGFGFPVLRFNFRGAGLSQGEHDHGRGEVEDVGAALNWLDEKYHLPMMFCGFSFGAATGLHSACRDDRVVGLISLGTPVSAQGRIYSYGFLSNCKPPKLFVSGAQDQFGPEPNLQELVKSAAEPKQLVLIENADHFFAGRLPQMQAAIREWIKQWFPVVAEAK